MSIYALVILIFLFLLLSTNGNAFKYLPFIIFIGILVYFFGWFFINFFWVIPLVLIYKALVGPKTTQRARTRTYRTYRTYTNQEAEEFFRDFFRQAGGQYSNRTGQQGYGSYGNYNSGYQSGGYSQSAYVDKSKYYKILGVAENCTKEELRKAYLKKVKEHHPDRFATASESEKKYHEDNLKKINEAYDNLSKDFS